MGFKGADEQRKFVDTTVRCAQRELVGGPIGAGAGAAFPHESWKRCPTDGIRALPLPEACGGSG